MILFNIIYDQTLEDRVVMINSGQEEKDKLIREYIPFIVKTVTAVTNYYIEDKNSEEYSLGLIGFNDAIDTFTPEKGKFLYYAKIVIKNKIIDFLKKKRIDTINIDDVNIIRESDIEDSVSIRIEVENYRLLLENYGLSIKELLEKSPKHKNTRERCFEIASNVFRDELLLDKIKDKKRLPLKEISLKTGYSLKVIKGNKEFILSILLIYLGEFQGIFEFLELDGWYYVKTSYYTKN